MATSGSVNYSQTAREIITTSLEVVGVLPEGETPPAEQAATAQKHLNMMLKTRGVGDKLFLRVEGSVTLIASTAAYTASPVSLARRIRGVWRRTSGIDTPLQPYSREEYLDEPNKTGSGMPRGWYFNPQRATRTLTVIGVPDATIAASTTLRIDYDRVLEDIDALDDDIDYPQEWIETVTYNLARRLIIPYRKHLTDPAGAAKIEEAASFLLSQLDADSQEDASVFMGPA
jgi:hypothetical protein